MNIEKESIVDYKQYGTKDTDKIHAVVGDYLLDLKCLIDNQAYAILDRIVDVNTI